jgi:hypothetical protein
MSNKLFTVPTMAQRNSQINFLNNIEKDRRDSQEFVFPDANSLHRRRQSADYNSATQSEDDDGVLFEVSTRNPISFRSPQSSFLSAKLFI